MVYPRIILIDKRTIAVDLTGKILSAVDDKTSYLLFVQAGQCLACVVFAGCNGVIVNAEILLPGIQTGILTGPIIVPTVIQAIHLVILITNPADTPKYDIVVRRDFGCGNTVVLAVGAQAFGVESVLVIVVDTDRI